MRQILVLVLAGSLLFGAGILIGQKTAAPRKTLIHAFCFNPVDGASAQQFDELWAATRKMAAQDAGIQNIWMGKIVAHQGEWKNAIVMEFANEAGHKKYETSPAHAEWLKTYSKVRAEPTFTFDLQGQ